jgi:threonine dehydratase
MTSRWLNGRTGSELYFKCENFQRMGAFKFRGAYNAISSLTQDEKKRGIIAHSSGNHAQAVALAAQLLDIGATIVMPEGSPKVKIEATRDTYGASVVFCKNSLESRESTTARLIEEQGYVLIHPYDDERIIAGAGTAAFELVREVGNLDLIIAPVGGGGLISGTSVTAKMGPGSISVCAAEPEQADDAYRSLQEGRIVENIRPPSTIADGLRTNLRDITFRIIQRYVDEIVPVSEAEILEAMRILWERMKLVVEPSGAVALAGVLSGRRKTRGKRVGVILSGGNIDMGHFFEYLSAIIA